MGGGRPRTREDNRWEDDHNWRSISSELRALNTKIDNLVSVIMPQPEIERALDRRVTVDTFEEFRRNLSEWRSRVDSQAQRIYPWVALALSALFSGVSLFVTLGYAFHWIR